MSVEQHPISDNENSVSLETIGEELDSLPVPAYADGADLSVSYSICKDTLFLYPPNKAVAYEILAICHEAGIDASWTSHSLDRAVKVDAQLNRCEMCDKELDNTTDVLCSQCDKAFTLYGKDNGKVEYELR